MSEDWLRKEFLAWCNRHGFKFISEFKGFDIVATEFIDSAGTKRQIWIEDFNEKSATVGHWKKSNSSRRFESPEYHRIILNEGEDEFQTEMDRLLLEVI